MKGEHIAKYAKSLAVGSEEYTAKFSKYTAKGVAPEKIAELVSKVKAEITDSFKTGKQVVPEPEKKIPAKKEVAPVKKEAVGFKKKRLLLKKKKAVCQKVAKPKATAKVSAAPKGKGVAKRKGK